MEEVMYIVVILVLCMLGYFLFRYLEGDYTIEKIELISVNEYRVKMKYLNGIEAQKGMIRREVYKYTYQSKRFKFVTKEFKI